MTEGQRSEVRSQKSEEGKESSSLPNGWKLAALGDVGEIVSGGTPSTTIPEYWNGGINWITPNDLSGYFNKYISQGEKSISEAGLVKSSARLLPEGSVLFSSRAPIGYVAISSNEVCTNQGFKSVIPNKAIFNEYLYYFLKWAKRMAEDVASGTTFKEISLSNFSKLRVPLPPSLEQHRIVAKIEELFSSLDKGIENLKTAQQQLKVYRQAVLKWAFEGKLTNKTVADGELPEGWRSKRISEIVKTLEQGWSPKCENERSFDEDMWAVIKTTAVQPGCFVESENKALPKSLNPRTQHELQAGDVLITRAGPKSRAGVCCVVKHTRRHLMNCDKVYRIRVKEDQITSDFLGMALNAPNYFDRIEEMKTGISDSGVNLTQKGFLGITIEIPCLAEQDAIVAEIKSRLSVCDKVEESIEQSLKQAESLRQSILKKAFEGKLVPQDPSDEPASVLLERIRKERAETLPSKLQKGRRK